MLGVFVFITSCENDIQEVRELTIRQDSAVVSAEIVEISYTTNGKINALMKAPKLNRYLLEDEKPYLEFPEGMQMFFYNDSGNVSSSIKSNYSIYYEEEGKWIAKYDVEAVNDKGEKLNTEYLVWLRAKEEISSDQFVKITTTDGIIYGDDGFVSNQSFTKWEVINGRGILNIDTDDTLDE